MTTSALLRHGPAHAAVLLDGLFGSKEELQVALRDAVARARRQMHAVPGREQRNG